jgi:membrane protease subunit HflC
MKKKNTSIQTENSATDAAVINTAPREKSSATVRIVKIIIAVVLLVAILYFGFTFEVREGNCVVVLRFGAPRAEITEAGLYFKLPWPFETVVQYENRLQYFEMSYLETLTKDSRNIIFQSYVVWKVEDPLLFHNSVGANGTVANYIDTQVRNATNSVMGMYNLTELVSLDTETIKTDEIQAKIYDAVKENCEKNYGISVVDVSILRLSLPDTPLQSVFEQMRQDRQTDIDTIIAAAKTEANKITSESEADAAEIIAGGINEAAAIKAQTEKEVASIYAQAQAANLELYTFLKELDTLMNSVDCGTVLIVGTDSYPFNILKDYSDMLEGEGDETIIKDLSYILTQLPENDRQALVDGIYSLISEATKGNAQ